MNAHTNVQQRLTEALASGSPLIMDGGMGTELKNRGAFPCLREYQQLWSAAALLNEKGRQTIVDAHLAFIEAGADVIITNTYACTPEILGKRELDDQLDDLIATGCNLAKEARQKAGKPTIIAGSMPPISVTYRPDLSPDESVLRTTYQRIAAALAPHVDMFICETVSSILEARVAASVAREFGKPVWVACTLSVPVKKPPHTNPAHSRGTKRVHRVEESAATQLGSQNWDQLTVSLRSGESIAEYASALDSLADALLFNCSTPEATSIALKELREYAPRMPCGAYANHFQPVPLDWLLDADEEGGGLLTIRGDLTPETYARYAQHWRELGANVIGGCCGITPAHISHLSDVLSGKHPAEDHTIFEVKSSSEDCALKKKPLPLTERVVPVPQQQLV